MYTVSQAQTKRLNFHGKPVMKPHEKIGIKEKKLSNVEIRAEEAVYIILQLPIRKYVLSKNRASCDEIVGQ